MQTEKVLSVQRRKRKHPRYSGDAKAEVIAAGENRVNGHTS